MAVKVSVDNHVLVAGELAIVPVGREARLWVGPTPWAEGTTESEARETLKALARTGITAIVDLNAKAREGELARELGLEYRPVRVKDDGHPLPPGILKEAVTVVTDLLQAGHCVYLHCTQGRGRSPTVAAAYLIASEGLTSEDARQRIRELDRKWPHRGIWSPPFDEHFPARLKEFEALVRGE